jgi:hypothetical protein
VLRQRQPQPANKTVLVALQPYSLTPPVTCANLCSVPGGGGGAGGGAAGEAGANEARHDGRGSGKSGAAGETRRGGAGKGAVGRSAARRGRAECDAAGWYIEVGGKNI